MMLIAYADPPYIGQAQKHYADDPKCAEVDHIELILMLNNFDAWALSCSSTSIWTLARLQTNGGFVLPENARIGAWVKPFCSFKPNVNPAYAWEPVLFWGGRNRGRELPTVRDWISASPPVFTNSHRSKVKGEKPEEFAFWLFEMLGMIPDDEFIDLYPGSGGMRESWRKWRRRLI